MKKAEELEFDWSVELKSESKYQKAASGPYNLSQMNSNDFAVLVHWLYKTEIIEGSLNSKFDDIAIMKATRDGGRDCILYKDGSMAGAIQCKHTTGSTFMSASTFMVEYTKFLLYSIAFPDKVSIKTGYVYYVASSGEFEEACINLLNDHKSSVISHPKFKTSITRHIKDYKMVSQLKYDSILVDLKKANSLITIKRISGSDMSKLLKKPCHKETEQTFFSSHYVVDAKLTAEMMQMVKVKTGSDVAKRPSQLPLPAGHIPRSVQTPEESVFDLYNEKSVSLVQSVVKYQYIAFLGWGLSGKSTEIAYAAHQLSSEQYNYHVFVKSLGEYKGEDIQKFIPKIKKRPESKILLFLDGLDEIVSKYLPDFKSSIKAFKNKYPEVKLVVSCRNNAFLEEEKPDNAILPYFTILKIKELDSKSISTYLDQFQTLDRDDFERKLSPTGLFNLISTPFFLVKFVSKFIVDGTLYKNKAELFEDIIQEAIADDIARYHAEEIPEKREDLSESLTKLSLIMEIQGKNIFNRKELAEIIRNKQSRSLIINSKLIDGYPAKGEWKFFHHNIQEYLAAKVLSGYTFDVIRPLITTSINQDQIRPSLVNTISFLIGMLEKKSLLKKELIDLLSKNEPALFMKFEADYLDEKMRRTIFQNIFEQYKATNRRINLVKFDLSELANFSNIKANINYLLDETQNAIEENEKVNALDLLIFFNFEKYPAEHQRLKALMENILPVESDTIKFKIVKLLIHQYDYNAHSFSILFNQLKNNPYTHLRAMLFFAIDKFNLALNYRDIILAQAEYLAKEESDKALRDQANNRSGSETLYISMLLDKLNDLKSVELKLKLIKKNFEVFKSSTSFRKTISSILSQAETYPNSKNVTNLVLDIFVNEIKRSSIHTKAEDKWVKYFLNTGQNLSVFKKLLDEIKGINWINSAALVNVADNECLKFLANEVSQSRLSLADAENFQAHLMNRNFELAVEFYKMVDPKLGLKAPNKIDFKKIESDEFAREIRSVFSKSAYIIEVNTLFSKSGKKSLKYMDIHTASPKNHAESQFYYWLYSSFDFKGPGERSYDLQEVLNNEAQNWEQWQPSRIYELIKRKSNAVLNTKQVSFLEKWCRSVEDTLDFEKEVYHPNHREIKYPDEVLFIYFARQFNFTSFKSETYLNMLSYYDGSGDSKRLYHFVSDNAKKKLVNQRVIQNLADKKVTGGALSDHVKYIREFNCQGATNALYGYLRLRDSWAWEEILNTYLEVGGDPDELFKLLPTVLNHNLYYLFRALVEIDLSKLTMYLKDLFNVQSDRKPELAGFLMQLGDLEAMEYYLDFIKTKSKVPEFLSVHAKIYVSFSSELVKICLEIFRYGHDANLQSGFGFNPFGIAVLFLRTLASDYKNYSDFKDKIVEYNSDLRVSQPKYYKEVVDSLERNLESWDHNYMLNHVESVSLSSAITQYEALNR